MTPNILSVNFDDAHLVYTTKTASTPFDVFLHSLKCKVDNVRVRMVQSPKYTGPIDE